MAAASADDAAASRGNTFEEGLSERLSERLSELRAEAELKSSTGLRLLLRAETGLSGEYADSS